MERGDGRRTAHVLVIEPDTLIRHAIEAGLRRDGLVVTAAGDAAGGIESFQRDPVDVVLLDLVLPDIDGFALLAAIRMARPRLPVIVLTADERTRVDAFARGADDCMSKPFGIDELVARVHARLRRREEGGTLVEAGPLSLDLASRRASLAGRTVSLSARESSLLAAFARHAGEVMSREDLLREVWELDFDPGSNVVEVYVAALRRKLGASVVETVRGRGYRLRVSSLTAAATA